MTIVICRKPELVASPKFVFCTKVLCLLHISVIGVFDVFEVIWVCVEAWEIILIVLGVVMWRVGLTRSVWSVVAG
jgi:hypothetical protein